MAIQASILFQKGGGMTFERKSLGLLVVFLVLLGIKLFHQPNTHTSTDTLPELPAALLQNISRVELVRAGEKTVLELVDNEWRVSSPYEIKRTHHALTKCWCNFVSQSQWMSWLRTETMRSMV